MEEFKIKNINQLEYKKAEVLMLGYDAHLSYGLFDELV